jgi:hypothetical protein
MKGNDDYKPGAPMPSCGECCGSLCLLLGIGVAVFYLGVCIGGCVASSIACLIVTVLMVSVMYFWTDLSALPWKGVCGHSKFVVNANAWRHWFINSRGVLRVFPKKKHEFFPNK